MGRRLFECCNFFLQFYHYFPMKKGANDVNSILYQDFLHCSVDKIDSTMGTGHQRDYWVIFNPICHKALSGDGHSILFKRRTTPFENSRKQQNSEKKNQRNEQSSPEPLIQFQFQFPMCSFFLQVKRKTKEECYFSNIIILYNHLSIKNESTNIILDNKTNNNKN